MIKASLITTCKGRLGHLKSTAPTTVTQLGVEYEFIVVDYGDSEGLLSFVREDIEFKHRAMVQVLENTDTFNLNRARNFGAKFAAGEVLAFVDADVFLADRWLSNVINGITNGYKLVTREGTRKGITGTFAVSKDLFELVGGFDEALVGWGHDEVDFCRRCRKLADSCTYNPDLVRAIPHTDAIRTAHYDEKDKAVSHARNIDLSAQDHELNPEGIAQGQALYYRHPDKPYIT